MIRDTENEDGTNSVSQLEWNSLSGSFRHRHPQHPAQGSPFPLLLLHIQKVPKWIRILSL